MKKIFLTTTALFLMVPPAFACAVCFADPNDPATKGLVPAIIALLGFLAVVFGGLISFFLDLRKRAQSV